MAKRRYALERGGPKNLRLRWRWGMRDFQVALVGGPMWRFDREALKVGATVFLPDGSSLFLRYEKPKWWSVGGRKELHVERNGVPLPGSDGDPRVIGRRMASLIILFGLLRVVLGGLLTIFEEAQGPRPAGSVLVGIEGLLLIGLGVVAAFGRRLPVVLAAGLLAAELLIALSTGGILNPIGVVVQVLVILYLFRAWRRMAPRAPQATLSSVFE